MKKISLVFLVLVLAFAIVAPVMALGLEQEGSEPVVNDVQLYIIGLLASAFVYIAKLIVGKFPNVVIRRDWLTVLLYVASFGLALLWSGFVVPVFGVFSDPLSFVAALLIWISDVLVALAVPVSFATLVYNVLLKKVLDGLVNELSELTLKTHARG